MRVLITGANGQVGHALLRALAKARIPLGPPSPAKGEELHPLRNEGGRAQREGMSTFGTKGVDVQHRGDATAACEITPATRDGKLEDGTPCERIDLSSLDDLRAGLDRIAPDLIINAAAYTAVDRAEDEPDLAQRVNADAVGVIGAWAARHEARVLHYSTDYVFDGSARQPYREDAATCPLGVYGQTKLAGEIALRDSGARHLTLRTAWVYAARGRNFLLTMLRLAAERDELRIVDDQIGAPTPARLIADVTAQIVARWSAGDASQLNGLFHLVAAGQTSWCGFTQEIFARAVHAGLLANTPHVVPIATADYPTKAQRPAYSVLDTGRLRGALDIKLPDWQGALDDVMAALAADCSGLSGGARTV